MLSCLVLVAGIVLGYDLPSLDYDGMNMKGMDYSIFTVRNVPGYSEHRKLLLALGAGCDKAKTTSMADGTVKTTIEGNTVDGCEEYEEAVEVMNGMMQDVAVKIGKGLDPMQANGTGNNLERIVREGKKIEHFHEYTMDPSVRKEDEEYTFSLHTDAGVMIVMTSPAFSNADVNNDGLAIQLADSSIVYPVLPKDEMIFMFGEGGSGVQKVQPVVHGMRMPASRTTYSRNWFGRMYLSTASPFTNDCGMGRRLQAKASCDYKKCNSITEDASQHDCDTWCNDQMEAGQQECNKKCSCSDIVPDGGELCWMLCVLDLPQDSCTAPSKQKCIADDRELKCVANDTPTSGSSNNHNNTTEPKEENASSTVSVYLYITAIFFALLL